MLLISALSIGQAPAQLYSNRLNWSDYTKANLNISVFVFRDVNRNGVYDLGDRPMSGIAVDVAGNNRTRRTFSNGSGFANFRMSATDSGMEIIFPGPYTFQTIVPPRWSLTTGNESQDADFELRPGAPGDLVALPAPAPVGLMPELTISGFDQDSDRTELFAMSPTGEGQVAPKDATGHYTFAVAPGLWRVWIGDGKDPQQERQIEVGNLPVVEPNWAAANPAARSTSPVSGVNFDDLVSAGILKIPSGYGGLGWSNFVVTHQKFYDTPGYRNNNTSGEFLAYNGSGHPAAIFSDAPFDFVGGNFGASTFQAEGEILHIRAWRGEELAYEESLRLSASGPFYLDADFRQITRLDFETDHYWQFTADDLAFRVSGQ